MSNYVLIHGELHNYDELYHYGVKGMKWGHRKKQEPTSDIRKRYDSAKAEYKQAKKEYSRASTKASNRSIAAISPIKKHRQADEARWDDVVKKAERANAADAAYKQAKRDYETSPEGKAAAKARAKTAVKVGAVVAGTALAAYGAYKLNKYVKTKNCEIAAAKGRAYAEKLFETDKRYAAAQVAADKISKSTKASVRMDLNAKARERMVEASKESFRTAAKNVMSYKKAGGNLSSLNNLYSYRYVDLVEAVYGR